MDKGVFKATKKDGTVYYRSSITYNNKHISLGSFENENGAHNAYLEADNIISSNNMSLEEALNTMGYLTFDKIVSLYNFRDNGIYSANPLYISGKIIYYYLDKDNYLKFDIDDLFYYAKHRIQKRGNHLFVADCGSQISIASRYGIKNNAVLGEDYVFVNGDTQDYRYSNIQILNEYQGVHPLEIDKNFKFLGRKTKKQHYKTLIHINGNYIVGIYDSKEKAAIAYNKAADILNDNGLKKAFTRNVIPKMSEKKYATLYNNLEISEDIINLKF